MTEALLNMPHQHVVDDENAIGQGYRTLLEMMDVALTYPITPLDIWRINKCMLIYEHCRKYVSNYRKVEEDINKQAQLVASFDACKHSEHILKRCVFVNIPVSNTILVLNAQFNTLMERFIP